jgi:hypothetical protein
MNGKTKKMRRRLSIVALAASIAAVAIPAASAGGKYLGPGSNTVEKQGPYGGYWMRKHEATRVLGPSLNTVEKRGPYGAYWVSKAAQENQKFTPSVVDRLVGSPDPRDTADQGLSEPSMNEVHLYPAFPRADDKAFREIIQDAAQEHGAAGFGDTNQVVSVLKAAPSVLAPDYSHLPEGDRPSGTAFGA